MAEITKWGALGYQQVPGLANRIISRYLRGHRRNMLRFFTERGLLDLAERMRQIRHSRQGMMAKNRMFQEVLNRYAERATPKPSPEAAPKLGGRTSKGVDLSDQTARDGGNGIYDGASISQVEGNDGATGIVVEE